MTERFATSSGSRLYVEEAGTGPPLLALPGLGGGAWFFSGFARRLQSAFRVVSIDLPGTGRSRSADDLRELDPARWVSDLGELVARRVGEPVVLIGHSMGTILALHANDVWPEHVRGIVFVGGLPEVRPFIRDRLTGRAEAVAREGLAGWGPRASAGNFARRTLDEQPELVALFERLFELQDPATYVRLCEILLSLSARASLPGVQVPCLAISGAEDQYAPPDLVGEFMRSLTCPWGEVVLPACAHLPFLEDPQAFAAAVESFLETVC